MIGWQIFLHSVRQVTGNLAGALKVSALPIGVQFLAVLALFGPQGQAADPVQLLQEGGTLIVKSLLVLVVTLVTAIWTAVAWHRFILKNEIPAGFIPAFDSDRIWAYFLRSLGISILCILMAILLGMIGALIGGPIVTVLGESYGSFLVLYLIIYLPVALVSYRLSTALPAMAVDAGGPFLAGWEATRGHDGAILGLALVSVLLVFVGLQIGEQIFGGVLVLALLWTLVFNWFVTMLGVSILTTLYGHYIEGRELR